MKRGETNFYLLWLNWPVGCFRLDAAGEACFRSMVRGRGEVAVVRGVRQFLALLPRATHAICWEFRKEWFPKAQRMRVLATPSAGRELLPRDSEMPAGVMKVHGAFHGAIMSETAIACIFAHARGLYRAYDFQRSGNLWPRGEMSPFCSRVAGTRAVILGYGRIGKAIGDKLEALGVSVIGIRRRNADELIPACRSADWLVVVLPSDTGTDGIVSAQVLRALPRHAVLVNLGRGNAVDEAALARALLAKRIAGAFLDVFGDEPLRKCSPLAADIPGLVRLPHMSAFAKDYLTSFFKELHGEGILR